MNDADASPLNELNILVALSGTTLQVTDGGGTLGADLSSLVNDADADPLNEVNTSVVLNGTILEVTDAGGTLGADLSSVIGGNTLDAAYDHGGGGAGRTITADTGAVRIDGTGGLELATGNLLQSPGNPVLSGSLGIGGTPRSVYVSGRYAYVVDSASDDLKVIDISGAEVTSLVAHSLEAGNLQVRNDIIAQGQLQVTGGLNLGAGGMFSDGDVGVGGDVTITGDLTISGTCTGCVSDIDDADADPNNELNSSVSLNGTTLQVTDAGGTLGADLSSLVNDADASPLNELNILVALNGTTLQVTDGGGTLGTDLSSLVNDADADPLNEVNTSVVLNGTILEVTDAGGTLSADLSNAIGGNTLDAAYDQGGGGAGRTITADTGAVRIDGTGGLELATGNLLQSPGNPVLSGSLGIGGTPRSVYVSGRYAYVADQTSADLKVIDVSDPSAPSLVGSLGTGGRPISVYVSGRYAYVAEPGSSSLLVIDVSDPSAPNLVGSLGLGGRPHSVHVSGRYAYVVDFDNDDLKVIDVSDPSAPSLVGSLGIGGTPLSVYVSGRYAYVVDQDSNDLKVIDVSDPSAPSLAGSLAIGGFPLSVYVSGRYAYVVDTGSDDLKVIDVSDPSAPSLAGSLAIGGIPESVYVSGRYAYVVDSASDDLKVIDISGAEVTSLVAHSLEAGNLQVRNDIIAQGQLQVTGGLNLGAGGMFSDGNVGISGTLAIANDVVPTSSPANLVQLYAEDTASSELKVRDEAGNITTLSPHNFSLIGQPSEPLAWSFYSENEHGKINVDMLRAMRLLESLSGERLVHTQSADESEMENPPLCQ